jgi:hypothetical protein
MNQPRDKSTHDETTRDESYYILQKLFKKNLYNSYFNEKIDKKVI